MAIIDMQTMRYLNLLQQVAHVRTTTCFAYNNAIFFVVPRNMVHKAIGEHGNNIKRMQDQLGKRIRVVQEPDGVSDIARFILDIIKPVDFKEVEVKEQEIIITAGSQNKAALIGRNRRRHEELNQILKDIFGKELTIL